jgi:hypothetical protein
MEINKTLITNLICCNFGIKVIPKSDGRIEIPQILIKQMGWEVDKVFMCFMPREVLISKYRVSGQDVIIKVADGRIRIPAGQLKKFDLLNKEWVINGAGDTIQARPIINYGNVENFVNSLNEEQMKLASKIFGIDTKEEEPELIELDKNNPTIFKIINGPFTNKEKYLIPGIKISKEGNKIGFLIVENELFNIIRKKVVAHKRDFLELIFSYDAFALGEFVINIHPPIQIENELIIKAQKLCAEPGKFFERR